MLIQLNPLHAALLIHNIAVKHNNMKMLWKLNPSRSHRKHIFYRDVYQRCSQERDTGLESMYN